MELALPFKTILIVCNKLSKKLRLEIIEWFQIHRDKRDIIKRYVFFILKDIQTRNLFLI